jgi:hypothetical protein
MYGIKGPNTLKGRYFLGALKWKARLVQNSVGRINWEFVETRNGTLIRVGRKETLKYDGWYLSYDFKGKSKEVFLSKKPTKGSYWWVAQNGTQKDLPYTRTISAAAGKLKGWDLGVGPKAEKLKNIYGKPFRAYQAVLLNNPKAVPRYSVFSIAP